MLTLPLAHMSASRDRLVAALLAHVRRVRRVERVAFERARVTAPGQAVFASELTSSVRPLVELVGFANDHVVVGVPAT